MSGTFGSIERSIDKVDDSCEIISFTHRSASHVMVSARARCRGIDFRRPRCYYWQCYALVCSSFDSVDALLFDLVTVFLGRYRY